MYLDFSVTDKEVIFSDCDGECFPKFDKADMWITFSTALMVATVKVILSATKDLGMYFKKKWINS